MKIHLTDAGPHKAVKLDIPDSGETVIVGGSGVGKTAIPDLVSWCFWGCDRYGKAITEDVIRDGAKEGSVSVTFGKGTVIERRVKGKAVTRTFTAPGAEPVLCGTDADLRAQLGKTLLGTDPEASRVILFPGVWQRLAAGKLGGADLLKVLGRLLPKGDLRAEVAAHMAEAGHPMADHDPTDPKIAEERRKAAKQAASETTGRLDQARASLATIEADTVTAPSDSDVTAAKRLGILVTAWETYETQAGHHATTVATRARQIAARGDWLTRKTALGERPVVDVAAETAARAAVATAEEAVKKAEHAERAAEFQRASQEAEARRVADVAAAKADAERARVAAEARHAEEMERARVAPVQVAPAPGGLFAAPKPAPSPDGWPRTVDIYVHANFDESETFDRALKEWGWSYDEERGRVLGGLGYEHKITFLVGEDGMGRAVALDDHAIAPESP